MNDLIDRKVLRNQMYHEAFETDTPMQRWDGGCWIRYKLFENTIEAQPVVDAVPVVRCKDCEWWERIYDDGPYGYCHACKHGFYSGNWEISIYRRYKEDFFCADGERRTDEN